jgi:hypothetical protein
MKKQTMTKIIGGIIIFTFVISFFQFISPSQVYAASSKGIDWENPNKTGAEYSKYKFKVTDVVNSQVAMQVVGCTGVVNKVSAWAAKLLTSKKMEEKAKQKLYDLAKKSCTTTEKVSTGAAAGIMNFMYTDVVPLIFDCKKVQEVSNPTDFAIMVQDEKDRVQRDKLEGCYSGIAITLAKNQLTAMTRSAVSWVNAGFSGNPLYVTNIKSLTNRIERNIIEPASKILIDENYAYPYGEDFARSLVNYNQSKSGGALEGGATLLMGLTSDLGNFITEPTSYSNIDLSPAQRAKDANNRFSNDFSTGGWDAWTVLTQRDHNNPLGFAMQAAQQLSDKIASDTQNQKDEVMQNNGFLSQKKCVKWMLYDDKGTPLYKYVPSGGPLPYREFVYSPNKSSTNPNHDYCVDFEVTNPGTIIKDKISGYLGSPERQLELADTINESLNAVFSILISKLQLGGLSGLSSEPYTYTDSNMNWVDSSNSGEISSPYSNNGAYSSGFDLTRDLGNTYIYETPINKGNWSAKTGIVNGDVKNGTLSIGYIPEPGLPNTFYTTVTAGSTKIIDNGYNNWACGPLDASGKCPVQSDPLKQSGDRAFWDGTNWQNWRCGPLNTKGECTVQKNPIKQRGVIQIQHDYVVASKQILQILPNVMPKLGELDYCLPGPNPNYKTNSAGAQTAYLDWVASLQTSVTGKKGKYNVYTIDQPGEASYETLKDIFTTTNNLGVWKDIATTGGDCHIWRMPCERHPGILYFSWPSYLGNGQSEKNKKDPGRPDWIDNYMYFTNNYMFQNFYDVFDKLMNKLYFNNITNMFTENERTGDITDNPVYMSMAGAGYGLTKNMLSYNEDIDIATAEYKANIAITKSNINKLEAIRKEVSLIVKDAQGRRNDALRDKINKANLFAEETCKATQVECDNNNENPAQCLIEYNQCISDAVTSGGILSEEAYLKKYATCLNEEDMLYYDDNKIMNGGDTSENCTDNLDNDLDGFIDAKDTDCSAYKPPTPPAATYKCVRGSNYPITEQSQQNDLCESRQTQYECERDFYYHGTTATTCNWATAASPIIINTSSSSLYGCAIDETYAMKPMFEDETMSCFLRTEADCTSDIYIDEYSESYHCKFTAI